jgi:galactarate dehydratase
VVAITHAHGCGVAIDAPGAAIPIRTLRHIGQHANLARRSWSAWDAKSCARAALPRSAETGAIPTIRMQDEAASAKPSPRFCARPRVAWSN